MRVKRRRKPAGTVCAASLYRAKKNKQKIKNLRGRRLIAKLILLWLCANEMLKQHFAKTYLIWNHSVFPFLTQISAHLPPSRFTSHMLIHYFHSKKKKESSKQIPEPYSFTLNPNWIRDDHVPSVKTHKSATLSLMGLGQLICLLIIK